MYNYIKKKREVLKIKTISEIRLDNAISIIGLKVKYVYEGFFWSLRDENGNQVFGSQDISAVVAWVYSQAQKEKEIC